MTGGLLQLVASHGLTNIYLTNKPETTFFKIVYRRHTNFSIDPINIKFNGARLE